MIATSKLIALAALVVDGSLHGILKSWTMPFILIVLSFNVVAVRLVIPWYITRTYTGGQALKITRAFKLEARGFISSIINIALYGLIPHYVVHAMGDDANSSIYIALIVGYSLYLIVDAFGMVLVAKDETNPGQLEKHSYYTLRKVILVLLPVVLVTIIGAPLLFALFGKMHSSSGVMLVRLFALSALPYAINSIYVSFLHAQKRTGSIVGIYLSTAVLILVLSTLLIVPFERLGLGIAWLVSQSLVAAFLFVTRLARLWLPYVNIKRWQPILELPLRWWRGKQQKIDSPPELSLVPVAVAKVAPLVDAVAPAQWETQSILKMGLNDVVIILVGAKGAAPSALLKVPRSPEATQALQRHSKALVDLQADARLAGWQAFLPEVLAKSEQDEQYYLLEQAVNGHDAPYKQVSVAERQRIETMAMGAITELHRRTATLVTIDDAQLKQWVDEPIEVIRRRLAGNVNYEPKLQQIERELHEALEGRRIAVCWTHGDYWFGNILVTPDNEEIAGIIDWDMSNPNDLPIFDWAHLLISSRTLVDRRELGDVVQDLLTGSEWTPHEQKLLDTAWGAIEGDVIGKREMLLLVWLKHTAGNLTKSDQYEGHWLWMAKNVEIVLRCI